MAHHCSFLEIAMAEHGGRKWSARRPSSVQQRAAECDICSGGAAPASIEDKHREIVEFVREIPGFCGAE